ncbi:MAG: hypothetical protein WC753_04770 [Candidatus Gracilibacteria bacterium]|jgi:hypothetical protein
MSKNINQVYIANPITTNNGTDLMYFGRSPYGLTDDCAMLYSSFSAQFTPSPNFTAYAVICAGTTATGALQNVSGLGSAGQVLTSNGAAALPSWQAGGAGSGISNGLALAISNGFFM